MKTTVFIWFVLIVVFGGLTFLLKAVDASPLISALALGVTAAMSGAAIGYFVDPNRLPNLPWPRPTHRS